MIRVAIDVGGTFTDFAAFDDRSNKLLITKAPTTPQIIEGMMQCFDRSGVKVNEINHFVHGTTIAINTVIERKGAKAGMLVTKGFRDVLEIGRGNIPNAFDLLFATPVPLVPRRLRLEVDERTLADGSVSKAIDRTQAQAAIDTLLKKGVQAVAICLLHSHMNPGHELALKEMLTQQTNGALFVTASSELIRQYREFERSSTAVLNVYVGPTVSAYLDKLQGFLDQGRFPGTAMIMQSNGGTMPLEAAKRQPVRMMESGPVGGSIAAAYIGKKMGFQNVVAFDMGGTTAKVSIVQDGEIQVTDGYYIGGYETGYPLQLPVVDVFEVGAGGGSIAHIDETGALKVGPISAGAVPGPACYGSGDEPTVTDADLVLGRLNPLYFLGGEIHLDQDRARKAIERNIAEPLRLESARAAFGIVKIADTTMAYAVRTMTVERGYDPRDFVMVAYGGAGPAHAVSVARELGIKTVVIPADAGVFSAVGMLLADGRDEYVRSYIAPLLHVAREEIEGMFSELEAQGTSLMMGAGFSREQILLKRALEMRYMGQEFTLIIDLPERSFSEKAIKTIQERFHNLHELRYGHAFSNAQTEIVSLRLHVYGLFSKPELRFVRSSQSNGATHRGSRSVYFENGGWADCEIYRTEELAPGAEVEGPAIIEDFSSTTLVHPGDKLKLDSIGNLVISLAV